MLSAGARGFKREPGPAARAERAKRGAEEARVRDEARAGSDPELEEAIAWLAKGSSAQD